MDLDVKICEFCKLSKPTKDFFGKDRCYKCEYERKKRMKKIPKRTNCKICAAPLTGERRVYCSVDCLNVGKAMHTKECWYRRINYDTRGHRRRFNQAQDFEDKAAGRDFFNSLE